MSGRGITVYRGDSKSLRIEVDSPDGSMYDLTDKRLVLTVKSDPDSDDFLLQKEAVLSDLGVAVFNLSPTDTEQEPAVYTFDIELSNVSRTFVSTLVVGPFTVLRDITRKVPA